MAAGAIEKKNVQHHVLTKTELPAATREWTGNKREAKIQIVQERIQEFLIRRVQTLVQKGLLDSFEADYFFPPPPPPTPPPTSRGCSL